jgi:hypothetical protein
MIPMPVPFRGNKDVMDEWREIGQKGHPCPQATEFLIQEKIRQKENELNVFKGILDGMKGAKAKGEMIIEADMTINIETNKDIEFVKKNLLPPQDDEWYSPEGYPYGWHWGLLVNISPNFSIERRSQIMEELTNFAKGINWVATVYSDKQIHFRPPPRPPKRSLWERIVKWFKG